LSLEDLDSQNDILSNNKLSFRHAKKGLAYQVNQDELEETNDANIIQQKFKDIKANDKKLIIGSKYEMRGFEFVKYEDAGPSFKNQNR